MIELIQKIKLYTEAGIILEHMELFDELKYLCLLQIGSKKSLDALDIIELSIGGE